MVSLASPAGAMQPPPTPSLKRPTLGLKRDSSYIDTDDDASLSSSTKKLRVAFDPNVDVRIMDDWTDKSFDLVREEVRQGVERHIALGGQQDDMQYTKLLQLLGQDASSSEAPSSKLLKKYILAIDSKVRLLGECGKLVIAVLDLPWLGRDEAFVGLFDRFMCDLASAHAKYVAAIMERLVANFLKLPASLGRLPEETPVSRSMMFKRLHQSIRILLRQTPSASNSLMRMLTLEFPNDLATTKAHIQYQRHLLRLASETPEISTELLALVTQRLVNMDVQIQQDIEDLEEDAEERLLQRPSSKQGNGAVEESDDSDNESISESEETMTDDELRLRELRSKVAKMDGTLDLLFEHYTPLVEESTHVDSETAFRQLLSNFTAFVMPNRTRHAQFLVFHFSQTSPARTALFTEQCLQMAIHDGASSSTRLAACAYLASFTARGAHIPRQSVQTVVSILSQYLEDMRRRYEPSCRGPDRRNYVLYYAISQTLLYIFCFRWRDLVIGSTTPESDQDDFNEDDTLAEGRDLAWLSGLKDTMNRNIYSRLNPLKVCSQAIVSEFAKLANYLRFLYVFPLLETNKRLRLGQTSSYYGSKELVDIGRRETAWDRKTGEAHHQLEAYFPFDPYHLPKSKRWVSGDYNEWKLPSGMQRDEVQEDDEEEEEDDESGSDEDSEDE